MKQLLALLLFVPSLCLAQLPTYVPAEGLLGWYPFDGNPTNAASELYDAAPQNNFIFVEHENRFFISTEGSGAGIGTTGGHILFPDISISSFDEFSISGWVRTIEVLYNHGESYFSLGRSPLEFSIDDNSNMLPPTVLTRAHGAGVEIDAIPTIGIWNHWCASIGIDATDFYLNGELVDTRVMPSSLSSMEDVFGLGIHWWQGGVSTRLSADFDDFGIWNRALDSAEVMALYIGTPPDYGCTDSAACNYDPLANSDDGSCVSCELIATYCGEGTVWDSTLNECVGVIPPPDSILVPIPSCGEGTVWDPVNEECIIAIPADLNYDGCVSVNDLLVLLAVHGTCPPYPEWPDEPTDNTWTCGDPVTYWDYDYATVLIGDQCWFAENLHSTLYSDGTEIPEVTDGLTWADLGTGAWCSYNNSISNSESYGLLYNWHTVNSVSGLCPSDWHVPSDAEWITLEIQLGMPEDEAIEIGIRGNQGFDMKSTSGWNSNGNGSNSSGFSGLPGGDRYNNGSFANIGDGGYWWTSTASAESEFAFYRNLSPFNNGVTRFDYYQTGGFSVRCIKD